ncbi:hypothetical protein HPB49_017175 [Dermacentor silvarum]|uniref:Uncharacterized protein n=1 Tax=Dermacentor silvarum TaxID=543639 RepID=A0ACB8CGC8_DERSI|nr:hypothetical protein HPB49_017175 [Dermacentor silvarum]
MYNAEVNESSPSSAPEKTPHVAMHVAMNGVTPKIADEILLQAFRAYLTTSTHSCYVRGVLDNGSKRTVLREDVCKKLKLPSIRETDLVISTFGRARSQHTRSEKVVSVTLRSQQDNAFVQVEAVVVSFICDEMIEAPKTNKFLQTIVAAGKSLADTVVLPSVICDPIVSLLIGSDQLWKMMPDSSQIRWDPDNKALIAINTEIGCTLQGPSSSEAQVSLHTSTHICVLRRDTRGDEELGLPIE